MSNNNQQDSNQLTLLDILGFPSDQMLFSFQSKSLIYSLGSSIIHFNLSTNSKTFVQYLSNEIILLKYLDEQEKLLISILELQRFPERAWIHIIESLFLLG